VLSLSDPHISGQYKNGESDFLSRQLGIIFDLYHIYEDVYKICIIKLRQSFRKEIICEYRDQIPARTEQNIVNKFSSLLRVENTPTDIVVRKYTKERINEKIMNIKKMESFKGSIRYNTLTVKC
jgi:hypothetical protein